MIQFDDHIFQMGGSTTNYSSFEAYSKLRTMAC